jgi:hypothetical protein
MTKEIEAFEGRKTTLNSSENFLFVYGVHKEMLMPPSNNTI